MTESDIPQVFTSEYYESEYFAGAKGGKKFLRPNGTLDKWSYFNLTGESVGTKDIVKVWKKIFNPQNMLDVGGGRGTNIAYARDVGMEAEGFDWSKWATTKPPKLADGSYDWSKGGMYPRCEEAWLWRQDATQTPWLKRGERIPDGSYGLVTAIDLLEHIYEPDIDAVLSEIDRVAKEWIFLEIATVDGIREKGYIQQKPDPLIIVRQPNMVSGHVTVITENAWKDKMERFDWELRRDMREWFVSLVPENNIKNWLMNTILVFAKT